MRKNIIILMAFMMVLLSAMSVSAFTDTTNMSSYYSYDTLNDSTGALDLASSGDMVSGTEYGKIGTGYHFDRLNDYIYGHEKDESVAYDLFYTIAPEWYVTSVDDFSFATWFRSDDSNPEQRYILSLFGSAGTSYKYFYIRQDAETGYIRIDMEGNSGYNSGILITQDISDGNYHHLAVVHDNTNARLRVYLDGVEVTTSETDTGSSGAIIDSTSNLYIGAYYSGPNYFWNGDIDETYFFKRALTGTEISTYVADTETNYPTTTYTHNVDSDFKAVWTLDNESEYFSNVGDFTVGGSSTSIFTTEECMIDSCSILNGYNDYIYIPASSINEELWMDGADDFSIGGWFRSDDLNPEQRVIMYARGSGGTSYKRAIIQQLSDSGNLQFYFEANDNYYTSLTYPVDISDQMWHHFIFVNDNTNDQTRLYIDGELVDDTQDSIDNTGAIIDSTSYIYIGTYDGTQQFWDGALDELFISHYAMNDTEAFAVASSSISYPYDIDLSSISYAVDEDYELGNLDYIQQSVAYNGTQVSGVNTNDTVMTDSCESSTVLREYYVADYNVLYNDVDCTSLGYDTCDTGACVYLYRFDETDLVSYYDFEDLSDYYNVIDFTDYNGISNSPEYGKIGSSYRFDKVDDYLYLSNVPYDWEVSQDDDFSFAMWFRSDDSNPDYRYLFRTDGASPSYQFIHAYQQERTGYIVVTLEGADGHAVSFTIEKDITDQNYHHLAIVWDDTNTRLRVYLDGVEETTTNTIYNSNEDIILNGHDLWLGANYDGGSTWNGDIDEFYFFQRALTGTEISNYVATVNSAYPTVINVDNVNSDFKYYWTFENLTDSINEMNVTEVGGISKINDSIIGSTYLFDGVDDYLYVPASELSLETYMDGYYDFSIGGWIRSDDINPDYRYIFDIKGSNAHSYKYIFAYQQQETGYLVVQVESATEGQYTSLVYPRDISDGLWHHFIFVNDDKIDQTRLYFDGELVDGSQDALRYSTDIIDSTSIIYFGEYYGGSNYWDGAMDEMFLIHNAVNDTEAFAIANSKTSYPFNEDLSEIEYAIDEDDGLDIITQASTYNGTYYEGIGSSNSVSAVDSCISDTLLTEYFLDGYSVNSTTIDCVAEGYDGCSAGACIYDYRFDEHDIVAYYDFESLNDTYGTIDFIDYNGVTSSTDYGKIGSSYRFDATNDYLYLSNLPYDWEVNQYDDFSFAMWFRSLDSNPEQRYLFWTDGASPSYQFVYAYQQQETGYIVVAVEGADGHTTSFIVQKDVSDNNYHHLAIVWDNTNVRFKVYLDGIEETTTNTIYNSVDNIIAVNHDLWLGNSYTGVNTWNGDIDEFYFFQRVLTGTEISTYVSAVNSNYPSTYVLDNLNRDMCLYHDLDDTDDYFGKANIVSSSATSTTGQIGNAYLFSGSQLAYTSSMDYSCWLTGINDFSIGGWFRSDDNATEPETRYIASGISTHSTSYDDFYIRQQATTGYLFFNFEANDNYYTQVQYPVDISDQMWHHFIFVNDNTNDQTRLYIDGILVDDTQDSIDNTGYVMDSSSEVYLGGLYTTGSWLGAIDEFFISQRAMDDLEAQEIFNSVEGYPYLSGINWGWDTDYGIVEETGGFTYNTTENVLDTVGIDYCTGDTLTEYFLDGYNVNSTDIDCFSAGFNGGCVYDGYYSYLDMMPGIDGVSDLYSSTGRCYNLVPYAFDSDGGATYLTKGTTYNGSYDANDGNINETVAEDFCIDTDVLREFYIVGTEVLHTDVSCSSLGRDGCFDGACGDTQDCVWNIPPTASECQVLQDGYYAGTNNCTASEILDCISQIETTGGNETNTTTDVPYAFDEDGGLNYIVQASTYNGTDYEVGGRVVDVNETDYCIGDELTEFYLSGYNVVSNTVDCTSLGYDACDVGACIYQEATLVMEEVVISPVLPYGDDTLTGFCKGRDLIADEDINFNYTWKVNDIEVKSGLVYNKTSHVTTIVGNLDSSNFEAFDTVSLECFAILNGTESSVMTTSVDILNTPQEVDADINIVNQTTIACNETYSDIDGDLETTSTIDWYYVNGTSLDIQTQTLEISLSDENEYYCSIYSTNAYDSVTANSTTFSPSSIEIPEISELSTPIEVYSDLPYTASMICTYNYGIKSGYPVIRYTTPDEVDKEYSFSYVGSGEYEKTHLYFTDVGTYTNVEVECQGANGYYTIIEVDDIVSTLREDISNPVGSGGDTNSGTSTTSTTTTEDDFFEVSPLSDSIEISLGSTEVVEFEITNLESYNLAFVTTINSDDKSYNWMYFEDDSKTSEFTLNDGNSKFVRYYITIPEDANLGSYDGIIEIVGDSQIQQYSIDINVVEQEKGGLLDSLNNELFEVPFITSSMSTLDSGDVQEQYFKVKLWHILAGSGLIGGVLLIYFIFKP